MFLYVALIVLVANILIIELRKLNKRFVFAIKRKTNPNQRFLTQLRHLEQYRHEHSCLLAYLFPFNQQLVSPFCFSYILGNVAFNAYNIVYLMYFDVQPFVRAFSFASLLFQMVLSFTCAFSFILLNLSIRLSVNTFEAILFRQFQNQKLIKRRTFLVSYWKSLVYYEFFKAKHIKYYSMTAGPLGLINRESLLQV